MSFNPSDMINLGNYEEYFILYMDNELDAKGKLMVEAFTAQHPQLAEELELLMSTKLPANDVLFEGKEELLSLAMKLNAVDENLLLFIDDELPAGEKAIVAQRIESDKDYALQHSLLLQTKLDASSVVSYPNKKELYRHERRVLPLGYWMRIAAAVVILLLGSLFYRLTNDKPVSANSAQDTAKLTTEKTTPVTIQRPTPAQQRLQPSLPLKEESVARKADVNPQQVKNIVVKKQDEQTEDVAVVSEPSFKERAVVRLNADHIAGKEAIGSDIAFNKPLGYTPVTSDLADRTIDEDTQEPAVTDGDFKDTKKTPARGFFRKVSRFIERKTGIGTANADNELLIGAVALKLK